MTGKQRRDPFNHARSVNAIEAWWLRVSDTHPQQRMKTDSRLTLEVLHDIKEAIVDIWLIDELDLDLVQVAQSVLVRAWWHFSSWPTTNSPTKRARRASAERA